MSEKEAIRESMLERRRALSEAAQRAASREVCERLSGWSVTEHSDRIAGYLSFDNEVAVSAYLEDRLRDGARVALPRVEDGESMEYVDVADLDDVEEGAFGIREPVGEACAIDSLGVFLVPGVAFDRDGRRIGMGWGYYDRALAERRESGGNRARFVGICYDWQLVDDGVPTDSHDVDMDAIVTNAEIIPVD